MRKSLCLILMACGVMQHVHALAEEAREPVGKVYSIEETDIVDELRSTIRPIDTEKLAAEFERYQPATLHKLPRATEDKSFAVDMTYTLPYDIPDGKGGVKYPKGYQFNPLQTKPFTYGIVVIDGSDPKQVAWFKASPYFSNKRALLLLSDGFPQQLTKELQRPLYFLTHDIAERFQLKASPSIVIQDGATKAMAVREVKIEER